MTLKEQKREPKFDRIQNVAPESMAQNPMEVYYLDNKCVIISYVAGLLLLHPAIFE